MNHLAVILGTASLAITLGVCAEELRYDSLDGWKQVVNEKTDERLHIEYLPNAETPDDWSQMVTVQTFYKMATVKPSDFANDLKKKYEAACGDVIATVDSVGKEDDSWVFVGKLMCIGNKKTKNDELAFLKIIQGKSALYAVQWAKRPRAGEALVTDDDAKKWPKFLRNVKLSP
jgi:hypothetical protein